MGKLTVYDETGASVGELDVADALLVRDKGSQAVHDVIVAHQAARRAGTAATLRKGEVAGSNRKPWRQKGTGRARAGLRQSPVWRGGGVAFGPQPRQYNKKVNRKVARLAFRRALSDRIADGGLTIVEALRVAEPKTRRVADLMRTLKIEAPALFVTDTADPDLARAARNVPRLEVVAAKDVNVYQLVRYPRLVVSRAGMEILRARMETEA
jgi:large subunit ribosomal protein L4